MVRAEALAIVGGCVIDGGASERRGGANFEAGVSMDAACSGKGVRALGGAVDRVCNGITNSWATGRDATATT